MTRVLLMGYYGRANFGDDILMLVSYNLLRELMPSATLQVMVDGKNADYVEHLLPEAQIVRPGYHGAVDYIIHGGGGVFFDFATHALPERLLGTLLEFVGYPAYLALERGLRKALGRPRTHARRRLGLGIGVGTFTAGSPRLREKLHALADFDALWLRDEESVSNLARFHSIIGGELIHGSDLAFLTSYWGAQARTTIATETRPSLGVILRDWPTVNDGQTPADIAALLARFAKTYSITVFIFDEASDALLARALEKFPIIRWNPTAMSITDFTSQIAAQRVVLTSRAHGAICSACLGVPSVIIPIEPKLRAVHRMLPHASVLADAYTPDSIEEALAQAIAITPDAIARDVERNQQSSRAALQHISRWFT